MVARAFGSAVISFGLVAIPVKLYTTRKTDAMLSLHVLHDACGTRLEQQYVCPTHGEVVPREHVAKGYELARGQHVMLSSDELETLAAVSDNVLALTELVPADTVDPIYLDKPYYLGPGKGGARAYRLLGRAMRETDLVGVARYAARGKQHVVLVRPYAEDGLIMHQLRYCDEIVPFAEVFADADGAVDGAELDLAVRILEQAAAEAFVPTQYEDQVKARVRALVEQKHARQAVAPAPSGAPLDIMNALEASLEHRPASPLRARRAAGRR